MSWLKRLLGKIEPHHPMPEDGHQLEEARKRRRDIIQRLVVLGVEADVLLAEETERKRERKARYERR